MGWNPDDGGLKSDALPGGQWQGAKSPAPDCHPARLLLRMPSWPHEEGVREGGISRSER